MAKRTYGWRRSKHDSRDHKFKLGASQTLPSRVDLRGWCPSVYDQGNLGSCTANALAALCQYSELKEGHKISESLAPSRLFIYWNERDLEGSVSEDAGAELRDGIKSLATWGFAPEALWPYDPARFAEKPPAIIYTTASQKKITSYAAVGQDLTAMKTCLYQGHPIAVGFSVYQSFESDRVARTGLVPVPDVNNELLLGGHAVLVVGYDDSKGFICRNSWGPSWGINGYFVMPYAYLLDQNLASDFWTIRFAK